MTDERWRRVKELLQAVLEREGEEPTAFLDGACLGDPFLREEVESLISSHGEGSFLEKPPIERPEVPSLDTASATRQRKDALASFRKLRGHEHPLGAGTLRRLVSLYEAWGKAEQNYEYRTLIPAEH